MSDSNLIGQKGNTPEQPCHPPSASSSEIKDNIVVKEVIFINSATGDFSTEHEFEFFDEDPLSSDKKIKEGNSLKTTCRKRIALHCHYCKFSTAKRSKFKLHIFLNHYRNIVPALLIKKQEFEDRNLHPVVFDESQEKHPNMELQLVSCPQCTYNTLKAANLERHVQVKHTQEDALSCPFCDIELFGPRNLQAHLVSAHTKFKCLYCPYCEYLTVDSSELKTHFSIHAKESLIFCSYCYTEFLTHVAFKTHLLNKHRDKIPLHCPLCLYSSNFLNYMKYHLLFSHSLNHRIFICSECDFLTSGSNEFGRHMSSAHNKVKPFSCFFCEVCCRRFPELQRHIRTKHTNFDPFMCPMCKYHSHESHKVKEHIQQKHKGEDIKFIYTRAGTKSEKK